MSKMQMPNMQKTTPDQSVEGISSAEYHQKRGVLTAEKRAWEIKKMEQNVRAEKHRYFAAVHTADKAVVDEGTSLVRYMRSGVKLMTEGEKLEQDVMTLNYTRSRTWVLEEEYKANLGLKELPEAVDGKSTIVIAGFENGTNLLAAVSV